MFPTYIFIGIILILAGIVSAVYLVRFLKSDPGAPATITALSESLSSIIIGIFYIYSAIVVAQLLINEVIIVSVDDDIVIIQEAETTTATIETTKLPIPTTITPPPISNYKHPNEDFLTKYQALLRNFTSLKTRGSRQSDDSGVNPTTSDKPARQCFEEVFMENSMLLYSFLHSVISLLMNCGRFKGGEKTGSQGEGASPGDARVPTAKLETPQQDHKCVKLKQISRVLVMFAIPTFCIMALYVAMEQDMQTNFTTKLYNLTHHDASLWTIINKPINVTTAHNDQVDDVVQNIYNIVNATQVTNNRRPKQLPEPCPDFTIIQKFIALLLFILYFVGIFYMKIKQLRLDPTDSSRAKQMGISIFSFGLLWLLGVLELFVKTYLFDTGRWTILSDLCLTLGNLNQVSIMTLNCLTTKEIVKRRNIVAPKA